MRYFAYGANLSSAVLARRSLVPASVRRATLSGYRLAFSDVGMPLVEPAFATLEDAPEATVHGVVYELDEDAMARLDDFEGGDNERLAVQVLLEDGAAVEAVTYRSRVRRAGLRPSRRYLGVVVAGATERGLDDEWIAWLEAHPSAYVPVLSEVVGGLVRAFDWLNRRTGFFDLLFH